MNKLKKLACISTIILATLFTSCNSNDNKVVIYSSAEDFRNEHIVQRLKEQFPNYQIDLQYISTGNHGAKLKAEGTKTDCDIVIALEESHLKNISDTLADLSAMDTSAYIPELLTKDSTYLPWERFSGCIAMREDLLISKGVAIPTSYDDLLKPEYKGLISMPNPKSSSTGYMFLKSRVNAKGEDNAFEYFDKLSENILQYTSSSSGPINALVQGEAAIGLGLTYHVVEEMNKGTNITVSYLGEGAPYSFDGYGIIKGKETKQAVQDVFNFLASTLVYEDKQLFSPEQIFISQEISIKNFPKNIIYSDMTSNGDAILEREYLLSKWKH